MAATQAQQNFVEQQTFEQGEVQVQNSSRSINNVSQTTEFSQGAAMQHGITTTLAQSNAAQHQRTTIQQQAALQSQPQQIQQQQQPTTIITPNVISADEFQSNTVASHKEGTSV